MFVVRFVQVDDDTFVSRRSAQYFLLSMKFMVDAVLQQSIDDDDEFDRLVMYVALGVIDKPFFSTICGTCSSLRYDSQLECRSSPHVEAHGDKDVKDCRFKTDPKCTT